MTGKTPALVWKGPAALRRAVVPIASLKPWPGNARRHDLPSIRASLVAFGQYRRVIVQASSRRVVAGHGTMEAAQLEGWTGLAVDLIDVADDAVKILLVDNRTNDLAFQLGYDEALLAGLLRGLPNLDATGFAPADLAALLAGLAGSAGKTDPDAVPEPPPAVSVPGDLWALGPHRLLCGDAGDPASFGALLAGERVDLLWTDPPYGVGYEGQVGNVRRAIANDALKPAALEVLLAGALRAAGGTLRPGAPYYVTGPAGDLLITFLQAMVAAGLPARHMIVWVKQHFVFGRSDYHYQHEPVLVGMTEPVRGYVVNTDPAKGGALLPVNGNAATDVDLEVDPVAYGWTPGGGPHEWHGGRRQSTVWQIPRPARSPLHPTQKPVELVERALRNSSLVGGVVLDPFAGSGTTLIAAHRIGRVARLVELDPVNVDVICRRWQDFSGGLLPIRIATGEEVSFANKDAGADSARRTVGHQRSADGGKRGRARAGDARRPTPHPAPAGNRR